MFFLGHTTYTHQYTLKIITNLPATQLLGRMLVIPSMLTQ